MKTCRISWMGMEVWVWGWYVHFVREYKYFSLHRWQVVTGEVSQERLTCRYRQLEGAPKHATCRSHPHTLRAYKLFDRDFETSSIHLAFYQQFCAQSDSHWSRSSAILVSQITAFSSQQFGCFLQFCDTRQ